MSTRKFPKGLMQELLDDDDEIECTEVFLHIEKIVVYRPEKP